MRPSVVVASQCLCSCKFSILVAHSEFQYYLKNKKNQLDATCYFIVLLIGSTCFGH